MEGVVAGAAATALLDATDVFVCRAYNEVLYLVAGHGATEELHSLCVRVCVVHECTHCVTVKDINFSSCHKLFQSEANVSERRKTISQFVEII